jgi:hypothetical protein
MALREIISNLAVQLDCDIADQKRYCQRKLDVKSLSSSSSSKLPLAILDKLETATTTTPAFPSFSWAISTRHTTKRFSPVRFDLLLLRVLRRWNSISKRCKASRKFREFATQLVGLRRIRIHRERRLFLKLCSEREDEIYQHVGIITDERIMSRQKVCLRAWLGLLEAVRFRKNRLQLNVLKRWRSKHETNIRVKDFQDFLIARKQLTTLRAWRRRYVERQMKVKFDVPLLGVFLKWRSSSRSSRARSVVREFARKLIRLNCEKIKNLNLKFLRLYSEKDLRSQKLSQDIENQRVERVQRNILRNFQHLLIAKSYCAKRFRRIYFRCWIETIVRVRHTTAIAIQIRDRRKFRYVQTWRRARVDRARQKAGTEMALLYARSRRLRKAMSNWQYYCKSRILNRRYQKLAMDLCKKKVKRVWMRWQERYLRRLYAHAAYAKTRVRIKQSTFRRVLRRWRTSLDFLRICKKNEKKALMFRNRRLKSIMFRDWFRSTQVQLETFQEQVRVRSLKIVLWRWRRRVARSNSRRHAAFQTASIRAHACTRRVLHAWLEMTRISRLGRKDQIVLASSHWAATLLRGTLRKWHVAASRSRVRRSEQMNLAANFWYEHLMSRMFKRWHAVTMGVLDDFSRYDGGW